MKTPFKHWPIALIIVATLLVYNCSKDPEQHIPYLNGYWEIDEVILSNGTTKDYNYNDTIDFIELSDSLSGTRRKLKPNFNGSYETSKSIETFQLELENDSLKMYYKTPYSKWSETILDANKDQLKIINNTNKDVYIYKRYKPITLDTIE